MKRREFVAGTVGIVGAGLHAWGKTARAEPCPPESLQAVGGSSATTACLQPPAAGTPVWLQNKGVYEWFQIPGTNLSSAPPSPVPGGISGPASKISAWCGAALKRSGSVYMIGAAGGHGDYYGNEVNAITLGVNSPAWSQLRGPSPDSTVVNFAPVNRDFRRASTHTYYSSHFINQDNRLVLTPAEGPNAASLPNDAAFRAAYPSDRLMCSFSLDTGDWDASQVQASGRGYYANWPGAGDWTACLACSDPTTGDIYYARSGGSGQLWKFTRASNAWAALATISHSNYAGSAVDYTRGRMLVVGDYGGTFAPRVYRTADGDAVAPNFGGLGADALKLSGYPAVVYDEHNDRFLVFKNGSPITIYSVNPVTWDVQLLGTTGSAPNARQNGILNAVQYVPELKGIAMAHSYTANLYFMRLQ